MTSANSSSSSTAVLVAGSALLAAGWSIWASSTKTISSRIEYDNEIITGQEICDIYEILIQDVDCRYHKLVRYMQIKLPELEAKGRQIPNDNQLLVAIRTELQRELIRKKTALLQEHDIDHDCFDEAVDDFVRTNDTQVKSTIARFNALWEKCTGEKKQQLR